MGQDKLTEVRHALWNAIENYEPLDTSEWCKFKDDGEYPYLDPDTDAPDINNVPALGVWPAEEDMGNWLENTNQICKVRYEIRLWTAGFELASGNSKPERWAWLIREAIWRAGSGGSTTPTSAYVYLATCFFPQSFAVSHRKFRTGNEKSQMMTLTTISVQLMFKDDPRSTD